MPDLMTLLAAGAAIASLSGQAEGKAAVDDGPPARSYWRAEAGGWRRVTRERGALRQHEWSPLRPDERRTDAPLAPSGLFRPWINIETSSWPEAVGIGDLNGDGRNDVAVVTSFYFDPVNDYRVFVFLQTATGTLQAPVKYTIPDAYSGNRSLDVGDVTGDGRDDVVVGSGANIIVLRQNASGTLDAPALYATEDSNQIKIGDFNHDGRKDVAGIDWGSAGVAVYLQNASGTLDAPTSYPAPHGGWDELEAGDVNADGRDDLVVMSGQGLGADLNVLLQLPGGGFALPTTHSVPGNELTRGAEVADVNGDARNDVVLTYGGNQPAFIGIFAQNTLGTLNAPFSLGSYDIPEPVESADLDGNGRADLAVLHGGWNAMGVYLQSTSGLLALEALEPIPYASHYEPQGIAIGDVNGDGRRDVVIADYNQGLVVVYQKSPVDLGVAMDGPTSAITGSDAVYQIRVTNYGSAPVSGAVLRDTPSSGLQYVTSEPAGACSFAAGVLTCPLPTLQPNQEASFDVVLTGIASGTQVNLATVSTPVPDGYPGDNSASVATTFQGTCLQRLQDGSFEFGTSPTFWSQASTNFGTPLCTTSLCGTGNGTAGPHAGAWWAWFGGFDGFEQGDLTQSVNLPTGTARLRFQLWIGARSGNGSDSLRAFIDDVPVFTVLESAPGYGTYTTVDVDVSAFANGGSHVLRLRGVTFGPLPTNFSVDEVSLEWCPLPTVSVSDASSVPEGNAGQTNAVFAVSLSQPTAQAVVVGWSTGPPASGTAATPGADYAAGSGTLTFTSGSVSQPLLVPVLGDALDEFDESFAVTLTPVAGATLSDPTGIATILDDDPLPTISVGDATLVEGQSGATPGQIPVSLSAPSGRAISFNFATGDGTAVAGNDYTTVAGGFSIPPGTTTRLVAVPVLGDTVDEQDETFTTLIAVPDFAVVGTGNGVATIDDDDGPTLAIAGATVGEGDAGSTPASFALSLSGPSVQAVTLDYATNDGTATAGADFSAVSGTLTFAPGATTATVTVPVAGDTVDEPNEFFSVQLTNAVDATPISAQAEGAIVDDDGGPFPLGSLSHGTEQWRTLSGLDPRDVFVLARPEWSSFEVQVDGASADLGAGDGPRLRRLAADLSTVLQSSVPVGSGPARALRVRNELATPQIDYIEVASAGCASDCGADDVYRIRVRETTLVAPRFNNANGQSSVVLLQNRSSGPVAGTVWFWSAAGALLTSVPVGLAPQQGLVLPTAPLAPLAGRSGSITVTHDAPYGGLVGKTVALEPTTGFGFDTPFEVRRR